MPSIQNLINMKFKKKPNNSLNPDEAIAAGAAIQGAILSGNANPFSESVTLLDITPLSLGVETVGGVMDVLIERGTFIPYNITKTYTTDTDYETSVLIKIFEGERRLTIDNIFVGEFDLTGIESAPRGIPKIEVNFNIDNNGIVTVSAEDQKSKEKKSLIVNSNKGRLTKQEIAQLVEEARELEIRDEIEKRKKLMHYECDDICCNILGNIKNKHFKLSEHNQNLIIKDIESVLGWIKEKKYYERSDDEIEQVLENLKRKYGQLVVRGCLETEKEVKELNGTDNNATSVYGNEQDDNDNIDDENKIIDKLELENQGMLGLTDPEISELKTLRKSLFDLCYSIFDIICNDGFVIDKEHKSELKDYIDDTLLWLHVHEKPTQIEYKQKIDEVNEICDKIMKTYEELNSNIFNENVLIKETTKKTELENMCISLDIMIKEKKIILKTEYSNDILSNIKDTLDKLYSEENITEEYCENKIGEINDLCNKYYNLMNGINLEENVINLSNHIFNDEQTVTNLICDNDNTQGTSIEDLLRLRQEEQIQQMLIDTNVENVENAEIEEIEIDS
jgi:hypothetical protein